MTGPDTADRPAWAVAIFAARENKETLTATIRAGIQACVGKFAVIDLIINGNPSLAGQLTSHLATTIEELPDNLRIRIWETAAADKANAWNRYVHELWPDADLNFFVDGYASVQPDALVVLADALRSSGPSIWAATGVPSHGRSAASVRALMLRDRGLHGNLYALPRHTLLALRRCGFRLPLGLYRTDGILGAALKFALDPVNCMWEPNRILVCARATWDYDPLNWHRIRDLRTHFRRRLRQAQGRLENAAVRQHWAVERNGVAALPATRRALIINWMRHHPLSALAICLRDPLCWIAGRAAVRPEDGSLACTAPRLLAERPNARNL